MLTYKQIFDAPKSIISTKVRTKSHAGHSSIDVRLKADGVEGDLSAVVRLNLVLVECFSCILLYEHAGMPAMDLLRVNGDHGGHRNPGEEEIITGPHVHLPLDVNEPASALGRPSFGITLDAKCAILPFAWQEFCQRVSIAAHARMARAVGKLHTSCSQGTLDGLFDD